MSRKSYYGFGFILIKSCQKDCKIHKIQCTTPGMLFVCNKTSILMCPSVGVNYTHPFRKKYIFDPLIPSHNAFVNFIKTYISVFYWLLLCVLS